MAVQGSWSFATAETPDGRLARLRVDGRKEEGPPVSFRPGRTATVVVRDEEGNPRAGVEVLLRGDSAKPGIDVEYAFTDEAGRAVIPMLIGGRASVFLRDPHLSAFAQFRAGTVDLEKGDALLETVYPSFTPVEIRVRVRVDGVPGLPPVFNLNVRQGGDGTTFGDWGLPTTEEDPIEGRILVTAWLARPFDPVDLSLGGPGFYQKGLFSASRGKAGGPVEAVLDLATAGPRPRADATAKAPPPPTVEFLAERANRVLDTERVTFEFKETALSEVLSWIAARHGLNIVIDGPIEADLAGTPVTVAVKDRNLREAILEVLKVQEDLALVVRNGTVTVVRK
jgi:hypothetical protein